MPDSQNRCLRPYKGVMPSLKLGAYVDATALVIGDVVLEEDVSVWPMVVIRGDVNRVRIGARTNIQDAAVIHESRPQPHNPEGHATIIGEDVTVGHQAMLHGCTVGNQVLIGIGAIILDGAVIEDQVVVGAGALVTPGKRLQSGYLYTGSPARQARQLKEGELRRFKQQALEYVELKNEYLAADSD